MWSETSEYSSGIEGAHHGEEELLPISGLSHLVFCPRRWALIHLEGLWVDNRHTAEGRELHTVVHQEGGQAREGIIVARSLRLRSLSLGLVGVSDVVEFHPLPPGADPTLGFALANRQGLWWPVPVEHKRGKPQPDDCYHVQLAGQALCLEEMTGAAVPEGYLFHGQPRRRQHVSVDQRLRQRTRELAAQMHTMRASGETPLAKYLPKCRGCSLLDQCQPKSAGRGKSASRHLSAGLTLLKKQEA
ncbi:MAG: CRISPR-associated protein Cas4 [Desulfarculaceae bacterium]|nr:CRISPR-associated protein Cas4 [Desulfarculaceae bacterium]